MQVGDNIIKYNTHSQAIIYKIVVLQHKNGKFGL